jgi:hypothetical protein
MEIYMLSTSNKAKIVRSVVGCVPVDVMQYDCRRAAARLVLPEDEGEVNHDIATVIVGDARAKLAELSAGSVHCCVTSPCLTLAGIKRINHKEMEWRKRLYGLLKGGDVKV